jgi:hypothetical protein
VAAAAGEQRLDALAGRQEQAWQQVAAMIETKKPKEYEADVELLNDLKALAERDGGTRGVHPADADAASAACPQTEPFGAHRPGRLR